MSLARASRGELAEGSDTCPELDEGRDKWESLIYLLSFISYRLSLIVYLLSFFSYRFSLIVYHLSF
jgi:hypothetical protein